jgi:hypothetical protein
MSGTGKFRFIINDNNIFKETKNIRNIKINNELLKEDSVIKEESTYSYCNGPNRFAKLSLNFKNYFNETS